MKSKPERYERKWRGEVVREAILDQLSLLTDEVAALGPLLAGLPSEIVSGRPFDGTKSIAEMLAGIEAADRSERRRALEAFLMTGAVAPEAGTSHEDGIQESDSVRELLERLAMSRKNLVDLARRALDQAGDRRIEVGDEEVTPLELLGRYVQDDASVFRRIAERVYESRPAPSPGFTSR